MGSADVAGFTVLYMPADRQPSDAGTRLVPLRALLARPVVPQVNELVSRFAAYGRSHGAWDDAAGSVEGSLARIVEAALGEPAVLPSVKTFPAFLCGNEFACLGDERQFFGESAALSYSNNSSLVSMTTLVAPRSLSCGRAWSAFSALGSNSISLPNPRESTAKSEGSERRWSGAPTPRFAGLFRPQTGFAHNSGR